MNCYGPRRLGKQSGQIAHDNVDGVDRLAADLASAMSSANGQYYAEAFGIGWQADIAMPAFHAGDCASRGECGLPLVRVARMTQRQHRDVIFSLPTRRLHQICQDGARIEWGDQALFDLHCARPDGTMRIGYLPGADWTGSLPTGFYSTVAALACAWRGDVPLHASAVAWHGRAVLVAGPAGAGKSTSLAAMLAAGAELIGDDLSVLAGTTETMVIRRGRPGVRLHRDTVGLVGFDDPPSLADDASGKWVVRPRCTVAADDVPLGAVLLLDQEDAMLAPVAAAAKLPALLFRPRLQAAIDGYAQGLARLLGCAANHPILSVARPREYSSGALRAHGLRLLELAQSAIERQAAASQQ